MYNLLDNISAKIQQLATKLKDVERENTELRRKNRQLNADLEQQNELISVLKIKLEQDRQLIELEEKEKPGDLEAQKIQLQEQIDFYIQELDKVMEWLGKK